MSRVDGAWVEMGRPSDDTVGDSRGVDACGHAAGDGVLMVGVELTRSNTGVRGVRQSSDARGLGRLCARRASWWRGLRFGHAGLPGLRGVQ